MPYGGVVTMTHTGLEHRPLVDLARAYPVSGFFVTAYALSWSYWLVALGLLGHTSVLWYLPGGYGPATAGLLLSGVLDGRAGVRAYLRRIVHWRVDVRWYAAAVLGPPALVLAGVLLADPETDVLRLVTPSFVLSVLVYFAFTVVVGAGLAEEPGWRGFALPRLQDRLGPTRGTVLLGLLWAAWHLPLVVFVGYGGGGGAFAPLVAYMVGWSLLLTWLFNHARGSVLIAMLAHTSMNTSQSSLEYLLSAPLGGGPLLTVLLAAAVVTMATRGRLGYQPRTD